MRTFLATCALIGAGLPAWSEQILPGSRLDAVEIPNGCEEKAATTIISVVQCPSGLKESDLVDAGKAVCGSVQPCGVWFWADPNTAPTVAPDNHDGLTQAQIVSSRGVWVSETASFVMIEPVSGSE